MVKGKNNLLESMKDRAKKIRDNANWIVYQAQTLNTEKSKETMDKVLNYDLNNHNVTMVTQSLEALGKGMGWFDIPIKHLLFGTYSLQQGLKAYMQGGSKLQIMEAMVSTTQFVMGEIGDKVHDNTAKGFYHNTGNSSENLSTQLTEATKYKEFLNENADSRIEQAEHQKEIERSRKNSVPKAQKSLGETKEGLQKIKQYTKNAEQAKNNPLEAGRNSWYAKRELSRVNYEANKALEQADLHGAKKANKAAIKAEKNLKQAGGFLEQARKAAEQARNSPIEQQGKQPQKSQQVQERKPKSHQSQDRRLKSQQNQERIPKSQQSQNKGPKQSL